ncbi:hypothetical protein [Hoylesella buccalis]|uniref:hypothetical protein n=1 Tax=Hoylesella buccalis TaxID=28127 RepID=UPI0015E14CC3|nr:hypothetical protein [Hoylesella buccalis]
MINENRNKTYTHILKYAGGVQGLAILVVTVRNKLLAHFLGVEAMAQRLCCSGYVVVSA